MAFFCWLAYIQTPGPQSPEAGVFKLRADCKKLYWFCLTLDMLILLAAVVGVLALAAAVAYKALWR